MAPIETDSSTPKIYIICGKRRSGKSTFAQRYFPNVQIVCVSNKDLRNVNVSDVKSDTVFEIQKIPARLPLALGEHVSIIFVNGLLPYTFTEVKIPNQRLVRE